MPSTIGLSCALTTPFAADGAVDLVRLVEHARWCLDNGCDSLTLCGTTGEGASIGLAERERILAAVADAGLDLRREVLMGVAAAASDDAAAQARMALDLSCRALLVAPPFYFKNVGDAGLYAWFARFFDALGGAARDVILYHIPPVTQVPLSLELIGRLKSDFPEVIIGVKDSSADWSCAEALIRAHGDLAILIGDERLIAKSIRIGARGTICGLANVFPEVLRPVVEGQDDPRIAPLVSEAFRHPITPAIKALVAHRKKDEAWLPARPPLVGLSRAAAEELGRSYDRLMAAPARAQVGA